jgi:hypothetical protein
MTSALVSTVTSSPLSVVASIAVIASLGPSPDASFRRPLESAPTPQSSAQSLY